MIKNQFSSGNYNSWDELVRITLPSINKEIREEIIPTLDETLKSMLGYGAEEGISKQSIDVSQLFDDNQITGLKFELVYLVEEFHSPEAPDSAVVEDCEYIKATVSTDRIKASEVTIDINKGILKLTFEILFEEYNGDQAGVSK